MGHAGSWRKSCLTEGHPVPRPRGRKLPIMFKDQQENSGAGAQNMEERLGQVITKAILGVLFTEDFRMLFFCLLAWRFLLEGIAVGSAKVS